MAQHSDLGLPPVVLRVVSAWEAVMRGFLEGQDDLPQPFDSWCAKGYAGRGAGQVDPASMPEPWQGPLIAAPRPIFLGLNPGESHPYQRRGGRFAQQVLARGYTDWAAGHPYLHDPSWTAERGPNRYLNSRLRFLSDWTGYPPDAAEAFLLVFELYPWHSKRVTARMWPPGAIVNDLVLEPACALGSPLLAFGAPWHAIAEGLDLDQVGAYGPGQDPWPGRVPGRRVSAWRLKGGGLLVVESHPGSAGPPASDEVEIFKELVEAWGFPDPRGDSAEAPAALASSGGGFAHVQTPLRDLSESRQEANDAAAVALRNWLLAEGLAKEVEAVRSRDLSAVAAPGLDVYLQRAHDATVAACSGAETVSMLMGEPQPLSVETVQRLQRLDEDLWRYARDSEHAARSVAQLAIGVSARLHADDRVERLDRSAVAVLHPPAHVEPPTLLSEDGIEVMADNDEELSIELAGSIGRTLLDGEGGLRLGPVTLWVDASDRLWLRGENGAEQHWDSPIQLIGPARVVLEQLARPVSAVRDLVLTASWVPRF